MTRYFLFVLLGMFLMYIVLKILASNMVQSTSDITAKLADLARTQQVANLVRTNEFRELIKTREFYNLATSLAKEQMGIISQTLVGTTVIK